MSANGVQQHSSAAVFRGKKVFIITEDKALNQRIRESLDSKGAIIFDSSDPKNAIANVLSKNPDLIIYDDRMPFYHGLKVISVIKRSKPKIRILLLSKADVPQRAIDASAQGVSYTITIDANKQQIYNAVKHCLSISSVPRVESLAE